MFTFTLRTSRHVEARYVLIAKLASTLGKFVTAARCLLVAASLGTPSAHCPQTRRLGIRDFNDDIVNTVWTAA